MKTPKIKRYRMPVSRTFPTTHPRKGEQTYFVEKIQESLKGIGMLAIRSELGLLKLHTIRASKVWIERMKEVQAGRAVIELFYWSGKPYHKDENGIGQVVFATLDKDSGCGVQKINSFMWQYAIIDLCGKGTDSIEIETLAKNDGLSLEDFKAWFKGYDLSEPMSIIHFTSFRY